MRDIRNREADLSDFKQARGVMDVARQKDVLISQIDALQRSLDATLAQIEATRARVIAMEKTIAGRDPITVLNQVTGRENSAADAMKGRLIDLRIREADVLAKYPEGSSLRAQFLAPIREGIRETEASLARESETRTEVTTGIDSALQSLRTDLDNGWVELYSLVARKDILEPQLAARKAELSAMAATEGRLQSMAGELSFVWDEYRQCWDSLQRAKTSAALDSDRISNVVVVQPATYPAVPIKPNKRLNLMLGLVVGLGAGLGLALLREFMDETLKSERDVEGRLRVPVLASIPAKEFEQCR